MSDGVDESRCTVPSILLVFLASSCVRILVFVVSLLLLLAATSLFGADAGVVARLTLLAASVIAIPLLLLVLLGRMDDWRHLRGRRMSGVVVATILAFLLANAIHSPPTRDLVEFIGESWISLFALVSFVTLYSTVLCGIWLRWLCPEDASFSCLGRSACVWWIGVLLARLVPKLTILLTEPASIDSRLDYITLASGQFRGMDWYFVCVEPNWAYFTLSMRLLVLSAASAFLAMICYRVGVRKTVDGLWELIDSFL